MATNFYFNNFSSSQEQLLIEDLITESIRIYGHDVYYVPRRVRSVDSIFNEDVSSYYDMSYMVEMYIKNTDGFQGDGDFLSKFNIEIRDRVTFTLSRRTFSEEVGSQEAMIRPNEGDLIFFPLNRKIFQVKFVEHEAIFYQLGALQTYDLVCELFEYSGERIDTGIPDIDDIQANYSIALGAYSYRTEDSNPYSLTDEDGYLLVSEDYDLETIDPTSDNEEFQTESDAIIDFSEMDPFSEGAV
jgi:hypothetical protein